MCCAIHAMLYIAAGATDARLCFMQHATCKFMLSYDFECTIALCKFFKFCSVIFIPLSFALHCVAYAVFLVLVDKAGVLH